MKAVKERMHRLLAPRLVVLIGSKSSDGRQNIIPINNVTSISVEPPQVAIATYKDWITTHNLQTAEGFTISIPNRSQFELVWKLGQKYSGYNSGKDKIEEFAGELDFQFSVHGPVLKEALGWIECELVERNLNYGGDHALGVGQFTKAEVNPDYYDENISPKNNPKPFMQWERNIFAEASDIFTIDYYKDPGF